MAMATGEATVGEVASEVVEGSEVGALEEEVAGKFEVITGNSY